ncbi:hypothetical protein Pla163_26140 [Planctomycetes bacterium Pla163]|uniref:Uncharacterized protein n=1 Tax=Rohdeia mirabilis TaxID=2528008 RepID=A0A518D1X1_9BACT|nr:hypothetical protein Pla163_26140 [Planctomycetes bacterium Pla163]
MERRPDRDRTSAHSDASPTNDPSKPKPKPVRLDLERLDLTVEEVEERIRPGETNVFDK